MSNVTGGISQPIHEPAPVLQAVRSTYRALRKFARRKPVGALSGVFLIVVVASALLADLVPYSPYELAADPLLSPRLSHPFGTDAIGRDLFARVIHGSRISLYVGGMAVALGTLTGTVIGIISGYYGGWVDLIAQRFVEVLMAFPALVLALAVVSILGSSTTKAMIAVAIAIMPNAERVVRSATLSVRGATFVEAAQVIGASNTRVLLRHILPNVVPPIIVLASVTLGSGIIVEASLSFLGLGTQPPDPSWGSMLSEQGRSYMEAAPWIAVAPAVAISLTVLAFNMLGDAVRDVLDPKLRER